MMYYLTNSYNFSISCWLFETSKVEQKEEKLRLEFTKHKFDFLSMVSNLQTS